MHERMHACLCMCTFLFGFVSITHQGYCIWQQATSFSHTSLFSLTLNFLCPFSHCFFIHPFTTLPPPKPPNNCWSHCTFWQVKVKALFVSSSPHMTGLYLPPVSVSSSKFPFQTHLFTSSIYIHSCTQAIAHWFMVTGLLHVHTIHVVLYIYSRLMILPGFVSGLGKNNVLLCIDVKQ